MDEIVYGVLYKKVLLSEDEKRYQFVPHNIIKGLHDEKEKMFLDELNVNRTTMLNVDCVNKDYCVGNIYTEKQLKEMFPDVNNQEELQRRLFKEFESLLTIGLYDDKEGLVVYSFPYKVLEEELVYQDDSECDYNSFYDYYKEQIGKDFTLLIMESVDLILSINNINELHAFLKNLRDNKDKYDSMMSETDYENCVLLLDDDIINHLLEVNDVVYIKDFINNYLSEEAYYNDELEEDDELFEEDIEIVKNIFEINNLTELANATYKQIFETDSVEEVKMILNSLLEFYNESLLVIQMLQQSNYRVFKTLTYLNIQIQMLGNIINCNDIKDIRRKYMGLHRYNTSVVGNVVEELEELEEIGKSEEEISVGINSGLKELNELVGLEEVKDKFDSIFSTLLFKKRTSKDLKFDDSVRHMVFTGNPGTGKTTVANIIAPLFHKLGYIKSNKVAYVSAQDLIAEYVGQTAPKTEEVIKKNQGGIIVLDEAYIMAGKAQKFGNEAITVILKEMEKNRTMFIFAGYKKEMEDFIKLNSGLKSRVNTYIQFNDYKEDELLQMFKNKIEKTTKNKEKSRKLEISEEALEKVRDIIKDAIKIKDFGNGRFINNLFEKIITKHAKNTKSVMDKERLYQITEEDIPEDLLTELFFTSSSEDDSYKNTTMGFTGKILRK